MLGRSAEPEAKVENLLRDLIGKPADNSAVAGIEAVEVPAESTLEMPRPIVDTDVTETQYTLDARTDLIEVGDLVGSLFLQTAGPSRNEGGVRAGRGQEGARE